MKFDVQSSLPRRARGLLHGAVFLAAALSLAGCAGADLTARSPKAEEWFRRAKTEFASADFEGAHDSVAKALAIAPDDLEVRTLAAQTALASLDYAEVLRLLKGVTTSEAAGLRGRALWYKGDLEAAADELEAMLNDPNVKDDWAKSTAKLARRGAGRTPFVLSGGLLASVEMVRVSQVAPYFVVPIEVDGESALAMLATGTAEVVLDSQTRPEPSWVSIRLGGRLEVHDVPALAQDLSGLSKEIGAPIKALIGVNLLRHLNATIDFGGHQFVARTFAPPPPPSATRVDLHYVRGGGMVLRGNFGGQEGKPAALLVDTSRPFPIALDAEGWTKAGVPADQLKPVQGDPEQKLKEGVVPLLKLGAFDVPRIGGLQGVPLGDLEKMMQIDIDGVLGAGLLFAYRLTFADGGRMLWLEDDPALRQILDEAAGPPPGPAPPPAPPASAPPKNPPPASPAPKKGP